MKSLIACAVIIACLTSGCVTTDTIRTAATLAGNVQVPSSMLDQGRDAAKAYILAKYPAAAPVIDAVLAQFFPQDSSPVGPPQFVQVPIIRTTNITLLLTEEIGGSKTIDGSKVSGVVVEIKSKAGKADLPPTETKTVSLGEYVSAPVTPPVVVPDQPDAPTPDDGELPTNPELPPDL